MHHRTICFGSYHYDYVIEEEISSELTYYIEHLQTKKVFIVSDDQVPYPIIEEIKNELSSTFVVHLIQFPAGERYKTLKTVNRICEKMIEMQADRNSLIIAAGGGLAGNVAGMAAALLFRGLPLIHIPTTLMAASDSVLSLKQAVNLENGKNLVGHFYAPKLVYVNIKYLMELPAREIQAGLCETIKNLLTIAPYNIKKLSSIFNRDQIYSQEELNIILQFCIEAKTNVMQDDPYEKNEALCLEYGHTIGHALELAAKGAYNHGESIAFGMTCAAEISSELGLLSQADVSLHYDLLGKIGVNVQPSEEELQLVLNHYLKHDNKRGYIQMSDHQIGFVLLKELGKMHHTNGQLLTPVNVQLVKETIKKRVKKYAI